MITNPGAFPSYDHRSVAQLGPRLALSLLVAMLVFAPLIRGGNRPLPLLILELGALSLLAWVLVRPQAVEQLPRLLLVALGGLFALPWVQLVPLPAGLAGELAGHEAYAGALAALGLGGGRGSISVVPILTEVAWLALLPPLAVFLVVVGLRGSDVERLVLVFVGMACFQAVLALMQYGAGAETILRLGMDTSPDSGIGTYPSRNNLAGLLEMALPVALALLAASIFRLDRDTRTHSRRHSSWWARFKRSGAAEGHANRTLIYAAVCLVVLLGLVFSRSRMGIAMGMVGLVLTTLLLARNFGGRFAGNLAGAMTGLGLVLAATVGLAPVFARFAQDPMADGRWAIFEASWQAARDYFPFGSGAGTYVEVIAAYHPAEFGGDVFINHAHNDYLEWLVEGGVAALVLMLFFAVAYLLQWRKVLAVRNWYTLHVMQAGAGVGLLVLILHGLVDYNLRIPANQIYFALLAGVFFHSAGSSMARGEQRRRVNDFDGVSPDADPFVSPAASSASAAGEHFRSAPPVRPAPGPTGSGSNAAAEAWGYAPSVPDGAGRKGADSNAPAKRPEASRRGDNPFADGE